MQGDAEKNLSMFILKLCACIIYDYCFQIIKYNENGQMCLLWLTYF